MEAACRESLSKLQLKTLDLYLMHWPVSGNAGPAVEPPLSTTWRDLEALVELGLVRTIGVSNFSIKKLEELLKVAKIVPAVNQARLDA